MLKITFAKAEPKDFFRSDKDMQRSKEMLLRKLAGQTFDEIASFFGVSSQFTQHIIKETCIFLLGSQHAETRFKTTIALINDYQAELIELSKNL